MARTYAQIIDWVSQKLQDTGNAIWTDAELADHITNALSEISRYCPFWRIEQLPLETRHGTASTTTANTLVDSTLSQFLSTDVDKVIYNETDKTWAIVTAYVSASSLTLSHDIMASGEAYKMFNRYCYSEKQVDISQVDDYFSIESAEYPYRERRKVKILDQRRVLEIQYDDPLNDTAVASSSSYKDTLIHLATNHRLPNLTDYAGAVANSAGYAAAATAMSIDGLSGTETIPKDSLFTIASVRGTYRATAAAAMSAGAGTVTFYPGLQDAAVDNDVITITSSTLTPQLEEILVDLAAGNAAVSKGRSYMNKVNIGGGMAPQELIGWGQARINTAMAKLRRLADMTPVKVYPRT